MTISIKSQIPSVPLSIKPQAISNDKTLILIEKIIDTALATMKDGSLYALIGSVVGITGGLSLAGYGLFLNSPFAVFCGSAISSTMGWCVVNIKDSMDTNVMKATTVALGQIQSIQRDSL